MMEWISGMEPYYEDSNCVIYNGKADFKDPE